MAIDPNDNRNIAYFSVTEEAALKTLIARYVKLLFPLCLSWGSFSREQAFDITLTTFIQTIRDPQAKRDSPEFVETLFRCLFAECAKVQATGPRDLTAFGKLPSLQQPSLLIVREALMSVSVEDRELLLLRDQCHLPFARIGAILRVGERQVRSNCLAARERFRLQVEKLLRDSGETHAV